MSKLKSPKEYIYEDVSLGYSIYEIMINLTDDDIMEIMEKMQIDAYNQGVDDSIKKVSVRCKRGCSGEFPEHWYLYTKLAKKLKINHNNKLK